MLLHGMLRHLSTARKKEFKVILLTIIIFYVIQLIAFIIDPEIKKKTNMYNISTYNISLGLCYQIELSYLTAVTSLNDFFY